MPPKSKDTTQEDAMSTSTLEAPKPVPLLPDDIPDVSVPETLTAALAEPAPSTLPDKYGEHEALLQGFCQHLQAIMHKWMLEEHHTLATGMDATLAGVRDWAKLVFQGNEHAQYSLADALLKIQEGGIALRHDPYNATVQAVSPAGYPVTLHLAKPDAAALVEALPAVVGWLQANGYVAPQ